jgi:transaldolase
VIIFSAAVKLFVDSADPDEIGGCVADKATTGVTTSAARLAEAVQRAGGAPDERLRAICAGANGPVCVTVLAADRDGMLREARTWAAVAGNVVVIVPATADGIEVVRACAAAGIRTGVVAGTSPEQALAAARAGAVYAAASVGRVAGVDGYDVIRKLVALFRTYGVPTQVVASGIRLPTEIIDAAVSGAHAASAPGAVIRQLDAESSRIADGG